MQLIHPNFDQANSNTLGPSWSSLPRTAACDRAALHRVKERIELEMLRTEYAQLKAKAEGLGKSAQENKAIMEEKKSLVDPNMKSKLA